MICIDFKKNWTAAKVAMNFQKWAKFLRKKFIIWTILNIFKNFFRHVIDPFISYTFSLYNIFVPWTICSRRFFFWISSFFGHHFLKNHNFYICRPSSKFFSDLERSWYILQHIRVSSISRFWVFTIGMPGRTYSC